MYAASRTQQGIILIPYFNSDVQIAMTDIHNHKKSSEKLENSVIRAFFALKIPNQALANLEQFLATARPNFGNGVRWVRSGQIHLTLKFFKEFAVADTEPVRQKLEQELMNTGTSQVVIQGGGSFPHNRNPRVLWLKLRPADEIKTIAKTFENLSENFGYNKERRPFHPHITIGRVKKRATADEKRRISDSLSLLDQFHSRPFELNKILFIRSELTPQGPIYTDLFEIDL